MTLASTLPHDAASGLRARANRLRSLASKLEGTKALGLASLAGPGTWIGPVPDHCAADMRGLRTDLLNNATWLRTMAWRLEQQAITIEQTPDPSGPR